MGPSHIDVCVVGGGPAGAVTALRLAQLGHRVSLVERASFPRLHVGEALTGAVWILFNMLGLRASQFKEASLYCTKAFIRWERSEIERLEDNPAGFMVNREKFDMLLLKAAEAAGVQIIQPARVCVATRGYSSWRLELTASGQSWWLETKYLVDASGRNSFLPGVRRSSSPPTLALCGHLRNYSGSKATCIEAVREGWCWGAPVPDGLFSVMVFLDSRTFRQQPGPLEEVWRSYLAGAALFADISSLPLAHSLVARDATTSFAADPIGRNFLRVGEANFSLDPLSSTGVEKAMQTGSIAATVLHTMILRPERNELCERFYRNRQTQTVNTHAAWSADFYSKVARYKDFSFWRTRSRPYIEDALLRKRSTHPRRNGSFNLTGRVHISKQAQFNREPCLVNDEVCERMALLHPNLDRPVAFVDGIELERLLTILPQNVDIATLLARWSSQVSPEQAARIAGWLVNTGILEPSS